MRRVVLSLCLLAGTLLAPAPARSDDGPLSTLRRQLAEGDHAAALLTARDAVAVHPELPGLWYNLAGLEGMHGEADRALDAFERAVLLGFDDFRHADQDDDLGGLREHPRYRQLRTAWAAGLSVVRAQQALALEAGQWSSWRRLNSRSGALEADLRVRADVRGLQLEVRLGDGDLPATPPWRPGGGGLLVSLVRPENAETGEGRQHVDLGFGWQDGVPVGALRVDARWQQLAELSPKVKQEGAGQRLSLAARIPWQACGTLHPLLDAELGFNASYRRPRDGQLATASLLDDPGLGRDDRPWRRGVPLTVGWTDRSPAVQARVHDPLVRDGALSLTISALLPRDQQPGEARVVLRDHERRPIAERGVRLHADADRLTATVELTPPARPGSATLDVSVGAGQEPGLDTWSGTVAVLPRGWEPDAFARIEAAPAAERASLRYRYNAITAAVASRLPHDDASAMATTIDELEALLARVAATGSALPDSGTFLAVMPADAHDGPLACSLALPPRWQRGQAGPTLLLLARAPGAEQRAVDRAHRLLDSLPAGPGPVPLVLAVPHLPATHDPATARRQVARLLPWLREFLGCGDVHLAAVDLLGATAVELASSDATGLAGLLLLTGVNFTPYPDDDRQAVASRLEALPADLPIGWIWFPDEVLANDQAAAWRRALRDAGRTIEPSLAVPGGLGFDQAWMRSVLWAAAIQ